MALMSAFSRTPLRNTASKLKAPELSTRILSPGISPIIRKAFSTGLSNAVGRQRAEADEVRLILEFKCPSKNAGQVDLVALSELEDSLIGCNNVARVQRAVPISVFREILGRAGGTPFGIGLAQDNRQVTQLRKRGHDFETLRDSLQVFADPHVDVTVG